MNQVEKSIFSQIIDRELPAQIVYEDENTIAFLDINPLTPGHTLVVPKKPFVNVFDGDEEILGEMMQVGSKIAKAQKKAGLAEGVNLIMSNETVAGQEVSHAHLHVIPRFTNDGVNFHNPSTPYQAGEAEEVCKQLTDAVK